MTDYNMLRRMADGNDSQQLAAIALALVDIAESLNIISANSVPQET